MLSITVTRAFIFKILTYILSMYIYSKYVVLSYSYFLDILAFLLASKSRLPDTYCISVPPLIFQIIV